MPPFLWAGPGWGEATQTREPAGRGGLYERQVVGGRRHSANDWVVPFLSGSRSAKSHHRISDLKINKDVGVLASRILGDTVEQKLAGRRV